jgi:hypothetical protein
MEKLTRRKLITQASVGAGTVSVLAITAACASGNATQTNGNTANVSDNPLAVFVTDPAKGTLKIMKGTQEITVNNPGLANSLLSLA